MSPNPNPDATEAPAREAELSAAKSPQGSPAELPAYLIPSVHMPSTTSNAETFHVALESTLLALQLALRNSLMELGIQKPGPTEIGRRLGLDKSIAWKVGRIAKAATPLDAFQFVPGHAGTRIILEAFRAAKVEKASTASIESAFTALERAITLHAGDRNTAKAMVRAATGDAEQSPLDENLRREHFRTSSAIWGAQARVQVKTDFIAPGNGPGVVDTMGFQGFVDLLRLRLDTNLRIARRRCQRDTGVHNVNFKALDPRFEDNELPPLFAAHCTHPLPKIHSFEDSESYQNFELEAGRVGRTGLVTCLVATKAKGIIQSPPGSKDDKFLDVIHLRTPAELVVFTLFIHKEIPLREVPTAGLFGQLKMGPASHKTATDQKLPISADVETFQPTPNSLAFLEFPGHGKAVLDAMDLAQMRMGSERWQLKDFTGYRVRMAYPPVPAYVGIRAKLASRY